MNITAWMAMAGAVPALVPLWKPHPGQVISCNNCFPVSSTNHWTFLWPHVATSHPWGGGGGLDEVVMTRPVYNQSSEEQ